MVKSATIKIEEAPGDTPVVDTAPAVVKAKAEAIKTLATEKTTIRRQVYSNDNWNKRRFRIDASLLFLGSCIAYLVFLAPDDELRRSLPLPILGTFGSIILGYAGFAMLDDNNKRSTLAATDPVVEPE